MISNNVANIENENETTAFDRKRSSKGSKERPESRQRRKKAQNTIMNINIEMNMDKIAIQRDIYTFLDMMSDFGGI